MCYLCADPVPDELTGDPDTVARFARAFDSTAEALRDAARELALVANENITISLAIDEVRDRAEEVVADTRRVADRYQGAADTFERYANDLRSAQERGNGARNDIITNNSNASYWRHRARELRFMVQMGNVDPDVLDDLELATRRANYYDDLYAGYIGTYGSARESREQAIIRAINGLHDAESASGLNDGLFDALLGDLGQLWDLVSKYLGPVLEVLRDVLELVKQIVDLLALIVTILSIFIPVLAPLAAALGALSAVLGIAIFAASALLFLMGRETLGRVLADGIMAVVGVVTSKLGVNGWAKESLGSMIKGGFTTVASTTASSGTTILASAGEKLLENAIHQQIEAGGEVLSFVVGEGLDLRLGMDPSTPVWDMAGADPSDMLFEVADGIFGGLPGLPMTVIDGVSAQFQLGAMGIEGVVDGVTGTIDAVQGIQWAIDANGGVGGLISNLGSPLIATAGCR